MEYVGNKNEIYSSALPATPKYPELTLKEFQDQFHFLNNETEASMLQQLKVARITVHSELLSVVSHYETLSDLSIDKFGDEESALTLYQQAVFSLSASNIVGNQISTDTTAESAERQEALDNKKAHCVVQYRSAIDFLTHGESTFCFEVL